MSSPWSYAINTSTVGVGPKKSSPVPALRKPPAAATGTSMPASLTRVFFTLYPIRHKRRAILVAIITLVSISLCMLFTQRASLPVPTIIKSGKTGVNVEPVLGMDRLASQRPHRTAQRKQIQLDASQELAAVSSFLASLPQNAIPSSVDPLHPIDPQLVLDFDTRGPRAEKEVQAMVKDVWTRNPVFLYSKMHSPVSREIKKFLESLNLLPAPTIIDVDLRDDANVLVPLLSRLTGVHDLPVLIIGGRAVGDGTDIRASEQGGELRELIFKSGAVIDGAKKKKQYQKT